jgi:hypothetical protein
VLEIESKLKQPLITVKELPPSNFKEDGPPVAPQLTLLPLPTQSTEDLKLGSSEEQAIELVDNSD